MTSGVRAILDKRLDPIIYCAVCGRMAGYLGCNQNLLRRGDARCTNRMEFISQHAAVKLLQEAGR